MAQSSAQKKPSPVIDLPKSYPIVDFFEIKTSYGTSTPGFVLVPADFRTCSLEALMGEVVLIEAPDGHTWSAKIAGARDHGTTTSLLVEDWPYDQPRPMAGWSIRVPNGETPTSKSTSISADEAG